MIRIGAVDIDTSHPKGFAEVMNKLGRAKYTCVYNSGFRSDDYVQQFMAEFNIPVRHHSLEKMAKEIDIAFIHSCNWEKHIELARPFVEAGIPVMIDKPVVGNLRDCNILESWVKAGAVILGGSSFRYAYEFVEFMARHENDRGRLLSLSGFIGVDEFNYGIHVIEALAAFVPTGAHSVRCIFNEGTELYHLKYKNGVNAVYHLCSGIWRPLTMVVTTNKGSFVLSPATDKIYEAMLTRIFDFIKNKSSIAGINELTESIKIALAARNSREQGDIEIKLEDLRLDDSGYDGFAFEACYANAAR